MSTELELLKKQLSAFMGPKLTGYLLVGALWDPYFKSPLLLTILLALFGCSVG